MRPTSPCTGEALDFVEMEIKMTDRAKTCCFTGHRPTKLPWGYNENNERCVLLKEKLYDITEAVYLSGVRHFICGMAMGCDLYFCEILTVLRKKYTDIIIEAAIPCETQASGWRKSERERYEKLVAECDVKTMVSRVRTYDCMMKRNKYMVDNSSVLIAVFDGTMGGTMNTVIYAKQQGLEIIDRTIKNRDGLIVPKIFLNFSFIFISLVENITAVGVDCNDKGEIFNLQTLYGFAAQMGECDFFCRFNVLGNKRTCAAHGTEVNSLISDDSVDYSLTAFALAYHCTKS